jgi:hypothetical protein
MKFRTTLILLAALVLLVLAAYLMEKPLSERAKEQKESAVPLFSAATSEAVQKIESKSAENDVTLEKRGEGWVVLKEDRAFPADPKAVESALDTFEGLKQGKPISKNPDKQGLFEVTAEKGVEVRAIGANEEVLAHFFVGKTGPDFFSTYVRKDGSDDVFLANSYLRSIFDKSVKDWRNKRIFDFPVEEVKELTITEENKSIRVRKDDTETWWVMDPEKVTANESVVEKIASTLAQLRASDFAETDDPAEYELAKPQRKVTANLTNDALHTLLIGKKKDEAKYYVKNEAKKTVFVIDTFRIENMMKTLEDLKAKEEEEEEALEEEEKAEDEKAEGE